MLALLLLAGAATTVPRFADARSSVHVAAAALPGGSWFGLGGGGNKDDGERGVDARTVAPPPPPPFPPGLLADGEGRKGVEDPATAQGWDWSGGPPPPPPDFGGGDEDVIVEENGDGGEVGPQGEEADGNAPEGGPDQQEEGRQMDGEADAAAAGGWGAPPVWGYQQDPQHQQAQAQYGDWGKQEYNPQQGYDEWTQQQQQQQQQQPYGMDAASLVDSLRTELSSSSAREDSLSRRLANATASLASAREMASRRLRQMDALTDRVADAESRASSEANAAKEREANCTALSHTVEKLRAQLAEAERARSEMEETRGADLDEMEDLRRTLKKKTAELEGLACSIEIGRVEGERNEYLEELQKKKKKQGFFSWLFGWGEKDAEDEEERLRASQDLARSTLLDALRLERSNVEELEMSLSALQTNNSALSDVVTSRDSLVDELNDRVAVFEEDKIVLKAALRQLQKEMKEEAPRTERLVREVESAQVEIGQLREEARRMAQEREEEVDTLSRLLEEKEGTIAETEKKMEVIGTYVDQLEERLASFAIARREIDVREETCREAEERTDAIEVEGEELRAKAAALEAERDELKDLAELLVREREVLKKDKAKLQGELKSATAQGADLKMRLGGMEAEARRLSEDAASWRVKRDEAEGRLEELSERLEVEAQKREDIEAEAAEAEAALRATLAEEARQAEERAVNAMREDKNSAEAAFHERLAAEMSQAERRAREAFAVERRNAAAIEEEQRREERRAWEAAEQARREEERSRFEDEMRAAVEEVRAEAAVETRAAVEEVRAEAERAESEAERAVAAAEEERARAEAERAEWEARHVEEEARAAEAAASAAAAAKTESAILAGEGDGGIAASDATQSLESQRADESDGLDGTKPPPEPANDSDPESDFTEDCSNLDASSEDESELSSDEEDDIADSSEEMAEDEILAEESPAGFGGMPEESVGLKQDGTESGEALAVDQQWNSDGAPLNEEENAESPISSDVLVQEEGGGLETEDVDGTSATDPPSDSAAESANESPDRSTLFEPSVADWEESDSTAVEESDAETVPTPNECNTTVQGSIDDGAQTATPPPPPTLPDLPTNKQQPPPKKIPPTVPPKQLLGPRPPPPPRRGGVPFRGLRKAFAKVTGMHGLFTPSTAQLRAKQQRHQMQLQRVGRRRPPFPPPPGMNSTKIGAPPPNATLVDGENKPEEGEQGTVGPAARPMWDASRAQPPLPRPGQPQLPKSCD